MSLNHNTINQSQGYVILVSYAVLQQLLLTELSACRRIVLGYRRFIKKKKKKRNKIVSAAVLISA